MLDVHFREELFRSELFFLVLHRQIEETQFFCLFRAFFVTSRGEKYIPEVDQSLPFIVLTETQCGFI